jgi:hypothetical protein
MSTANVKGSESYIQEDFGKEMSPPTKKRAGLQAPVPGTQQYELLTRGVNIRLSLWIGTLSCSNDSR